MKKPNPSLGKHFKLIRAITEDLFEPEKRRLSKLITDINSENKRLNQRSYDGFIFKGRVYMSFLGSIVYPNRGDPKTILHQSLVNQMELWLRDTKIIETDEAMVNQVLALLLTPCSTAQQLRNALPECLINIAEGLSKYPRTKEAAYTLKDNERSLRQYEKVLPKIEIYSVTRLIF